MSRLPIRRNQTPPYPPSPAQAALAARQVAQAQVRPPPPAQVAQTPAFGPAISSFAAKTGIAVPQPALVDPSVFVAALQQARVKAGGVNRLACFLMGVTNEPLEQRTIFNWLKGQHLPRQDRMAKIYAVLTKG